MHADELMRLGAHISIKGQYSNHPRHTDLSGARVQATDLRAAAALVLAGMVATGRYLCHGPAPFGSRL